MTFKEYRDIEVNKKATEQILDRGLLSLENLYGDMQRRSAKTDDFGVRFEYFEGSSNVTK